jgi:hypothetical protein
VVKGLKRMARTEKWPGLEVVAVVGQQLVMAVLQL